MDGDLSNNGTLTYSLTQISPFGVPVSFTLNRFTGNLAVSGSIDINTDYQLIVTAMVCLNCILICKIMQSPYCKKVPQKLLSDGLMFLLEPLSVKLIVGNLFCTHEIGNGEMGP